MKATRVAGGFVMVVLVTVVLAIVMGCQGGTTSIKTLLDDPTHFDGKTVRIAGQVSVSAGVLGYGAYQVDDGTGTLNVVSQGGGAPREGAKVAVEGTFKSVYTLGTQSLAVLLETRRSTR
jgi:hypothetical protein